jgi:hypothetical protein
LRRTASGTVIRSMGRPPQLPYLYNKLEKDVPVTLAVSHYVFLTREQRYAIQVPESEVEVIGTCSLAWINDGEHETKMPEEVFVKYRFRHCPEPETHTIGLMSEGFVVKLSPEMPKYLKDIKDGGSLCLMLTHRNVVTTDTGDRKPVVHFLDVEDIHILEETLC